MGTRTQWPQEQRVSKRTRPRATRCDFWMNRRVVMTHRLRRSPRPINRAECARFGINCRSLKRERSDAFDTGGHGLLYWNSTARVSVFIGSYIPSAVNLNSSKPLRPSFTNQHNFQIRVGFFSEYILDILERIHLSDSKSIFLTKVYTRLTGIINIII